MVPKKAYEQALVRKKMLFRLKIKPVLNIFAAWLLQVTRSIPGPRAHKSISNGWFLSFFLYHCGYSICYISFYTKSKIMLYVSQLVMMGRLNHILPRCSPVLAKSSHHISQYRISSYSVSLVSLFSCD